MTGKLRIGVIGCGLIAHSQHLPSLLAHPRVDVRFVCDPNRHRRELAAGLSGSQAVADSDQVLGSDVDAVLIATHDLLHADFVEAALRRGKHVFVEKPLALETAAAERILALALERDLIVAVGFQRLHDPALSRVASLVADAGEVGLVHLHDYCHCNALVTNESLWGPLTSKAFLAGTSEFSEHERWTGIAARIFPGCPSHLLATYRLVMNLACHDLSVLVRLLGEPTAIEFADFWPEHFGVVVCRFGPTRSVLELGQTNRKWFDERLIIVCADGDVEVSWGTPFVPGVPTEVYFRQMVQGVDTAVLERFTHRSLFRAELWDFVDRIVNQGGRDDSLENAVIVTRWLERAIAHHLDRTCQST